MDIPAFLRFTPVPLKRRRHDGWTPARQLRFIVLLARGAGPDEAARQLGKSRQTAYALRNKAEAESFAAAWDAALAFARGSRTVGHPVDMTRGGIETILVPRHYRGRLIGFVQREDCRASMRALGQLDRLAERLAKRSVDFDELREVAEKLDPWLSRKADKADEMGL